MSTNLITNVFPSIDKFDGKNFHIWKIRMQMLLQERGLWSIVTGDEKEPKTPPEAIQEYQKRETKAFNAICMNVKDSLLTQVYAGKTAQKAWDSSEKMFQT